MFRSRHPWPVSRKTAQLMAAGGAVAALAWFVPPMRGGLFLLTGLAVAAGFVLRDTGYRLRRRAR
jgi:hypothetical protein